MDRTIVYPGSIPLDSDILSANRNAMIALGALMSATLGSSTVVDGLACTPTSPLSMVINIAPGSITSLGDVDAAAYGSLPANTAQSLVRMGINLAATSFTLTAPGGTGQAINYLIQATFLEADGTPVVLPYYNAANPSLPYSGPGNTGVAQNTNRVQSVQLQAVQGSPAVAGLQVTPTPNTGFVGLYVVTVNSGQTFIGLGSIAPYPAAPFVQTKLPALSPGYSNMAVLTSPFSFVPAQSVTRVKLRLVGGGGAGGNGGGGAGGGGAGGGTVEGFYAVTPGGAIACVPGNGGTGGGAGGASSFGALASAGGGNGGGNGSTGTGGAGATGGIGSDTGLLTTGRQGQAGFASSALLIGGAGGGSHFGDGAPANFGAAAANSAGLVGILPGAGGAGGVGSGAGGSGAPGIVIVEW